MEKEIVYGVVAFSLSSVVVGTIVKLWLSGVSNRLSVIERDLARLKESMPKEYVFKSDHDKDLDLLRKDMNLMKQEILTAIKDLDKKLERLRK